MFVNFTEMCLLSHEPKEILQCAVFWSSKKGVEKMTTPYYRKNFWSNSVQEFLKTESSLRLVDFVDMLARAITFYKLYYLILKRTGA